MKQRWLIVLCLVATASAQQYTISTVAGLGRMPFASAGQPAVNMRVIQPWGVAADSTGNVYFSDQYYLQVFRVDQNGIVTVYAGTGAPGSAGDSGKATAAQLRLPGMLATDPAGNLYIADIGNGNIRKVTPDGAISTVASVGGDGVALDTKGNLYVSGGNAVRIVRPDGTSSVIAGTGKPGYSGDKGQAVNAQLSGPMGLRVDASGDVFVADYGNNVIREIDAQGVITTFAGNGRSGTSGTGNNGKATAASLRQPKDVLLDGSGNLYIADTFQVRQVDKNGTITLFAGGGNQVNDGVVASSAVVIQPMGLALDRKGNVLVALQNNDQVRSVSPQKIITTVAGILTSTSLGENVPATSVPLLYPVGIAVNSSGDLFVADLEDNRVRRISAGLVSTWAGNGLWATSGDNGPAASAALGSPFDLGFDSVGNLYVTTGSQYLVRQISQSGTITTFAGGGGGSLGSGVTGASIGDGGKASAGTLDDPRGLAVDPAGNLYIADHFHQRIRRVDTSGIITTFAGTGVGGYSGDNGPATQAQLFDPYQAATDSQGNVYFADTGNFSIRKITTDGNISTIVGTGVSGIGGDGGPAVNAPLNLAASIAVDALGNLYTANTGRIRKVDAVTGIITTIAGNGTLGFGGDGGPATAAEVNNPWSIAVDGSFNVYFSELGNLRVRKLTPQWITSDGVLNAASLQGGAVSPGEIVTINIMGFDPTQTGGQILFDGNQATVVSAQSNQVTVIVPYEVDGQTSTQLQIVAGAITTNTVTVPVTATAPGIFTQDSSGHGAGLILNADSSPNSSQNPAARGTTITIAATGEGQTTPPGVDGQVGGATPPVPNQQVSVQIGGLDAPLVSAGGTPNQPAGYFQVVVQVPDDAPVGDVPIMLTVGGSSSQAGVIVSIQ